MASRKVNLIEQDHRGVKLRIGPMLGFKRFRTAGGAKGACPRPALIWTLFAPEPSPLASGCGRGMLWAPVLAKRSDSDVRPT
jgi:hypothetical protein